MDLFAEQTRSMAFGAASDFIVRRVTPWLNTTALCFANVRTWRSADKKALGFATVK